jgi:hypothetical protein
LLRPDFLELVMVKIYESDEESKAAGVDPDEVNKLTSIFFEVGEGATPNYNVILNALLKASGIIIGSSMGPDAVEKAKEVLGRIVANVQAQNRKSAN